MNKIKDNIKQNSVFYLLICYDVFLLIFSLCNGVSTLLDGMQKIINHSAALVVDYMVVGGISAAFFNMFLITTVGLILVKLSKVEYTGTTLASVLMLSGFGLFGKNIMNILPIIAGVYLYDFIYKTKTKNNVYVAIFGTAIGPIVTEIYIQLHFHFLLNLLISYIAGLFLGFILTPVSKHMLKVHKGFDLYNIGFTDGVVAICFISVLKMFGFTVPANTMHETINNKMFLILLLSICSLFIIMGMINNKDFVRGQINLNRDSGVSMPDFIHKYGFQNTLINMGLCGILATLFIYFMKAPLNGPVVGTIISIMGFCACGNNLRNVSFIFIASAIGQLCGMWNLAESNTATLATLLGTGLAPIGGYFGIIAGVTSGLLHISLCHFTSVLHLGLNLYNNGFVAGFVCMTLVPIFELLFRKKVNGLDNCKTKEKENKNESPN